MMSSSGGSCWALILAGGSGARLRSLTTTSAGVSIPKQFCSLRGGPSLLHEALQRALIVAPNERICVVVVALDRMVTNGPLGSENGQEHGVLNLAAQHSRRHTDAASSSTAGTPQ